LKIFYIFEFIVFYLWDLTKGAFAVAYDVITPTNLSSPGILKFPLGTQNDLEIALLANLITFSPGSMVVNVSSDRSHLFIHVMFLDDEKKWQKYFKSKFEARVLRILR